ncbi:MAG: DUF1566 domain-containing protein [Desulfobulbaceae bacterium]|uniref:DUF1566 domain-containing protein n=1 Tax=Candidatus Desulfobia pelagia TaxID=2841692 RepID=A0A8J6TGV9_9BACT|nr:DUF1566 domain-containing protein [Candidatus Desulfobia pelagia]
MPHCILRTGQIYCYNNEGLEIPCENSGQDAENSIGAKWSSSRFEVQGDVVKDHLTNLTWSRNANPHEFPVTWQEALNQISLWNMEKFLGFDDWRLPNRKELRSLMSYQAKKPSLPANHPFTNFFLNWYWTSTTAAINPAYAWYIHLEGARMFYGRKDQYYLFWPVRVEPNDLLSWSGQEKCYDSLGKEIQCDGSGQDGDYCIGKAWPKTRFKVTEGIANDKLTGLNWDLCADVTGKPTSWQEALDAIKHLNIISWQGVKTWRLPNINELESLVDCSSHSPALPQIHPFKELKDGYWSSTTSYFETDWAWVLYLEKGACGVGHKGGKTFFVWPVYG